MNTKMQKAMLRDVRSGQTKLMYEGHNWTPAAEDLLIKRYNQGVGISQISLELHRTEQAVFQKIHQLGLYSLEGNFRKRTRLPKDHSCLCKHCQAPRELCQRCQAFSETTEDL